MALNPTLRTDAGFEQPVSPTQPGPSAVSALARLGEAGFRSYSQSGSSSGGLTANKQYEIAEDEMDKARLLGFEKAIAKNEQTRGQVSDRQYRMRENQILRNFVLDDGDITDESVQEVYRLTTGRDFGGAGLSLQQQVALDFEKDPANRKYILVAAKRLGPEASEQELLNYAINTKAKNEVYAQDLLDDKISWEDGRREAAVGLVNTFTDEAIGGLKLFAKNGDFLPDGAMDAIELQWRTEKARISAGLNQEEMAEMQPRFQQVEDTLTTMRSLSGVKGFTTQRMDNVVEGINRGITEGTIPEVHGIALLKSIENQPTEFLLRFAALSAVEIHDYLVGMSTGTNVDPEEPATGKDYSGVDSGTLFNVINNTTRNQGRNRTNDVIVDEVSTAFSAMKAIGADHSRFTSVEGINRTFNGNVKKDIKTVGKESPDQALALTRLATDALDAQKTVATQVLRQMERDMFSVVDQETGQLVINKQSLLDATFSEQDADNLVALSNKYYGGDLTAMAMDKANRVSFADRRKVTRMGIFEGMGGRVKQLQNQKALIVRLDEEINSFVTLGNSFQDGDAELDGGAGEDTLQISVGNGPIAQELGIDFHAYEQESGLPTGYLETMAFIESRGNPNATNPKSTAGGLFQQLDANAKAYNVSDKFDPVQSTEGAVAFAMDNMRSLRSVLGRDPQGWELYVAHQQGPGGARKLFTADDNANAVEVLGEDEVLNNGGKATTTIAGFKKIWANKYNRVANSRGFSSEPIRPMDRGESGDQIEGIAETTGGEAVVASGSVPSESAAQPRTGDVAMSGEVTPMESSKRPPAERPGRLVISSSEFDSLSEQTQEMLVRIGVIRAED